MVLLGEQPAGTAEPSTGMLEETRDYYKSECCATHTRTEGSTKFFCLFTEKKIYSQQLHTEQTFNKVILIIGTEMGHQVLLFSPEEDE